MKIRELNIRALSLLLTLGFASCAMLCSCADIEKDKTAAKSAKNKKEKDRFSFLRTKETPKHVKAPRESIDNEVVTPSDISKSKIDEQTLKNMEVSPSAEKQIKSGDGKMPDKPTAVSIKGKREPKFYDDFIALNADEELSVSLIFNNAPLLDVLSAFADVLGFNFVADSNLKSLVTINLNSKMTRQELWNTFDRMLFIAGAGARVEDALLRIIPRNQLAQQPDSKVNSNSILYYPLTFNSSREVQGQLRSLLSPGGVCIDIGRPNAVLICESEANIPKFKQILEYLDRSGKYNWPRAIMPCHNVLPNKVVTELQEILPVLGFVVTKPSDRTDPPGGIQLIGMDRLQLIIASAATQEVLTEIRNWVKLLDKPANSDQEQVFVYKVRHNKAAHLVRALSVIFDVQGSSLTVDTNSGNTRIETINPPRTTSNATYRTTAASIANRNSHSAIANGASSMLTNNDSDIYTRPTRIFADGVLNRLIVRTNPRTYASIKALLDRLDVVPAQVLLQVVVVEVTLSESTQFGLEFSGAQSGDNIASIFGTNYTKSADNIGNASVLNPFVIYPKYDSNGNQIGISQEIATGRHRETGFSGAIYDPNNPQQRFGYIRAMAGNGNVKVISCPQILVSSNTEALVQVGEDVSVLSSDYTNTASAGSTNRSYVYKETGIILKVTPQITSTDLIALEIRQELSQPDYSLSTSSPNITRRVVDTEMTIANGQTMIIGGLIQEIKNDNLDSIPFINKIPYLNRLLGSTNANVERSEILVMVTGHIVDEKSKVEDMIKRYNEAITSLNDFDSKLGDRPNAKDSKPKLFTDKDFWQP